MIQANENPTPEDVKGYITAVLECTYIEVVGDGRHFEAIIISPEFEGLRLIARHQKVYKALGARMDEQIHALSMRTHTPDEYKVLLGK